MISSILIGLTIMVLLGAIHKNEAKINKRYEEERKEARLEGATSIRKIERLAKGLSMGVLLIFGIYMAVAVFIGQVDQNVILIFALLYMISYYFLEYLVHEAWMMTDEAVWCRRLLAPIPWENVVSYKWLNRKEQVILKLCYKGKGIITRRCELVVGVADKANMTKLLSKHYIEENNM